MHFLLGLTALVLGAVIATRRTRPGWFVITTSVLVGLGALFAVLGFARVTDGLGIVALNAIGWTFVGLSLITMLSAVFVLERRGPAGEELPPLIGDNPFDGDADDSDDPAPGTAPGAQHDDRPRGATPMQHDETHDDAIRPGTAPVGDAGASEPIDGTVVVGADPDIATPEGDEALRAEADEAARRDPAGPEDARRPEQP
ncbi:hypothetical protein OVA14_01450 [Agrococcus sp. SL85]|uniref:hypothetical protein n=1 Tax=Agrococcus sp. SL85 TaxID=2995141 RepID=UPI00226C7617|nr:hypothetical protein [Agrococcus sp. SL85]WAC66484.1 hypothetical protein OVA14_01450 [Agrococcus sp. SL85]